MSIGIYDCFGYGKGYDVPFRERYRLIKSAGFDCVMLWWSDQFGRGAGYREDAQLAKEAGLRIENMHAPVHEQNDLFLDGPKGESVFQCYLQCVRDCAAYQIPTVVAPLAERASDKGSTTDSLRVASKRALRQKCLKLLPLYGIIVTGFNSAIKSELREVLAAYV